MAAVTMGYAAFDLSGSATVLGFVSLATGLPMMLLSLVGGVVADRAPRRLVLMGTQTTLGLGAAAIAVLALTGHLEVWHLYALGFVQGTAFAFNMPARQAFIAELIPPQLLNSAVAVNNSGMNFARIAGPSLAGGLLSIPFVGVGGVFTTIAAMYGIVLIALVRLPERGAGDRVAGRRGWDQLVDGLRHIRRSPALLGLLTLGFIPLLFGMPFQTLLPLFAERVHGAGALGLGVMTAAVGAGALAGSVAVAILARGTGLGLLQAVMGVAFGLALVGFALAPSFVLAIVALVAAGVAYAGYLAVNETLIMAHTDREYYGRIMSVYLLSFGLMPVASFPEAFAADHVGGPATIATAGAIVVASVLLAQLVPSYRRLG
jgi:MFS family permease